MYKISTNSLFDQGKVLYLSSCHSTNALALELAHKQALEGTIVITDCQTAGQGQRGNGWEAEPGKNLTFSILFKPDFLPVNHQFSLTKLLSLAIWHALDSFNVENCSIKWPNDLYIGSQKVCGMLVQNGIQGGQLSFSVAGIGLNVNQSHFTAENASSLALCQHREFELNEVLNVVLRYIDEYYQILRSDSTLLDEEYLPRLYRYRQVASYRDAQQHGFEGTITGVDEIGRLLVRKSDQSTQAFDLKEIIFL